MSENTRCGGCDIPFCVSARLKRSNSDCRCLNVSWTSRGCDDLACVARLPAGTGASAAVFKLGESVELDDAAVGEVEGVGAETTEKRGQRCVGAERECELGNNE